MSLPIRRLVSCTLVFFLIALPAGAATFTVDDVGDGPDANPGDGTCATAGGVCTLRAAIEEANATANSGTPDTITFSISGSGPHVIQPASALPAITEPVYIQGDEEPDYGSTPVVVLDGQSAGSSADGLTFDGFSGDNALVDGLSVINFDGDGILLDAAASILIYDSYIGVAADGSAAGNGGNGINITGGSSLISIGVGNTNVISNNGGRGVFIGATGTEDNIIISSNLIGVDPTGEQDMGNGFEGVLVNGATNVTIGGTSATSRNVISGNGRSGVLITGGTASTTITGNYIGTNDDGDAVVSNSSNGIEVANGASATVGGTASGAGNVVAGNSQYEVLVETDGNTVQGNYLDTNSNGDDLGSALNALRLTGDNNQVGGTTASARNIIGHTATSAVSVNGTGNTLQGNYIGAMPDGTAIGHASAGIRVYGSGHTIGGVGSGEANTIANAGWGVGVASGSGHTIRGNRIFNQASQGIDFDRDGVTANDAGDGDTGPNRQQNFPEIQSAGYDSGADEVTVTYQVPSDPSATGTGASAYDLTVDFYRATAKGSGELYLGTASYTASDYDGCVSSGGTAPCPKTVTFTPAATVSRSDDIVATATDADGNTSEFSADAVQLPVELTAFAARADAGAVHLAWRTASETNNAGFEVQRKHAPMASFERVGFVEGHGTTTRAQRYRFEDAALPDEARRLTYRLKQIDTDGTAHHTEAVEVDLGGPDAVALHGNDPNPARQSTTIRYELPHATHVQLVLYDLLGRRVATLVDREQAPGHKSVQVQTGDLASGAYVYRLEAGSAVQVRRMTVMR